MKTKLGISVGIVGAGAYFIAYFGGYVPLLLIAGYVLLFESNEWLRKTVVKAVVALVSFALLTALIGFIPDVITLINRFEAFGTSPGMSATVITKIINLTDTIISLCRKLVFIILGLQAIKQGGISLGFIDRVVDKHTKVE